MLGCGGSLKIILIAYVLPEIVTYKLKEMNSESDKECILSVSKWKFWTHDSMRQPILTYQRLEIPEHYINPPMKNF